jgi:DNA damage-binding protein 1
MNMEEELEEDEITGFDANAQTLFCCNVLHDQLVQVTRGGVFLVDAESGGLNARWSPPSGYQVTHPSPPQVVRSSGLLHV